MEYRVTKTWGHECGLSVAFRQWRAAHSHCHLVHGYALAIAITFEAAELDAHGWVIDFGRFADLKQQLLDLFDHKTLVAADDPRLAFFTEGQALGVLDMVILPDVGCEAFAALVFEVTDTWLTDRGLRDRVRVVQVNVSEHGANTATVIL